MWLNRTSLRVRRGRRLGLSTLIGEFPPTFVPLTSGDLTKSEAFNRVFLPLIIN
jgi:hypothetical protein